MNILNKVTFKSLLKNKARTLVTIIGIALSSALLCTVTAGVSTAYDTMYRDAIYNAGDYTHLLQEVTVSNYREVLLKAESIEDIKYVQKLGSADVLGNGELWTIVGTDCNFDEKDMAIHVTKGTYPASSGEILIPEAFSGGFKIGEKLTLKLGSRFYQGEEVSDEFEVSLPGEEFQESETRTYTVSGFYQRGRHNWSFSNRAITLADEGMPENYEYDFYITIKNPMSNYELPRNDFYYLGAYYYNVNNELYGAMGRVGSNGLLIAVWITAAIAVLLVAAGAVSLIYNAFSISVAERTKLFGLLSSVGATQKQIKGTVIAEAIMVSLVGIPLGLASGLGIVSGVIAYINNAFGNGFSVPVLLSVNIWTFIAAIIISLVTVLISAWIPAKRATKISAIEAIHMTTEISDKQIKTSKLTEKLFGLSGVLASKYYKRSKKRYRTTIISLAFSIVLFISISGASNFLISGVAYNNSDNGFDLRMTVYDDFENGLTPDSLLEEYKNAEGITDAAYVYTPLDASYLTRVMRIQSKYISKQAQENLWLEDNIFYSTGERSDWLFSQSSSVVLVSDDAFKELLRQNGLDEKKFMNPDAPLAVVLDGLRRFDYRYGKYIRKNILDSGSAQMYQYYFEEYYDFQHPESYYYPEAPIYNSDGSATVKYTPHNGDYETEEAQMKSFLIDVGAVIYEKPYFIENAYSDIIAIYPISLAANISESLLVENLPEWDGSRFPYYCFLSNDNKASEKAIEEINEGHGFRFTNPYNYAGEVQSSRDQINALAAIIYIFIAVIALIAVANVFNTITTNINLRRREFAMLKSIGMTSGGFNGMMNFECVLYGAKSLLYGLPISAVILVIMHLLMLQGYDIPFHLPWLAICISVAGVFAAVFITMMYALNKVKKASPIVELKNENI